MNTAYASMVSMIIRFGSYLIYNFFYHRIFPFAASFPAVTTSCLHRVRLSMIYMPLRSIAPAIQLEREVTFTFPIMGDVRPILCVKAATLGTNAPDIL